MATIRRGCPRYRVTVRHEPWFGEGAFQAVRARPSLRTEKSTGRALRGLAHSRSLSATRVRCRANDVHVRLARCDSTSTKSWMTGTRRSSTSRSLFRARLGSPDMSAISASALRTSPVLARTGGVPASDARASSSIPSRAFVAIVHAVACAANRCSPSMSDCMRSADSNSASASRN